MTTPILTIRKSSERGLADHGWLKSFHSFSFADYYDPNHMGFRSLRVINEDYVAPSMGFGTHPHKDMEIITYVVKGELEHKDSLGNGSIIKRGDVQKMSAGTGVRHSEFNPSKTESVHLLQIWIVPDQTNLKPSYEQISYNNDPGKTSLTLVPVSIHQNAKLYRGVMLKEEGIEHPIGAGRGIWLQIIEGQINVEGHQLDAGDAISIERASRMTIKSLSKAEFLLFDLG
jgi:quercetin 2,3-dioxygenase